MKRIFSRKPTPAFVIACIALFVSMGGVSYAVATGSIDSREIKDNTIQAQDIRANSVTESEIKRRSLDGTDIKVERVGGNAVKEQVLEVDKLKQVPSAKAADVAANGTRWALINEQGQIERQTGGFTIVNCYSANANCYINAGSDVTKNGIHAQISVANTDGSNILSGETGTAACGAATVACAPPGTEAPNVLVVAPRDSAGAVPGGVSPPPAADAARFFVYVTGPGTP